jgi:hypothetical protein
MCVEKGGMGGMDKYLIELLDGAAVHDDNVTVLESDG